MHVLKKTKNHDLINTDIDYSFTSLRKLLPVLSGAEIYSNKHRLKFKSSARFPDLGEIKYSLRGLKNSRSGTSKMGHSTSNINYKSSSIDVFSKNIINNYSFDYSDITNKRRKNFMFWEKYLSNHDVTFLKTIENEPEICPYAFPCYVMIIYNRKNGLNGEGCTTLLLSSGPNIIKQHLILSLITF